MATSYSKEMDGVLDATQSVKADGRIIGAKLKRIRATIPYDGQASGDIIVLGELPANAAFSHGVITQTATMGGTATIAIGTPTDADKFRAAATSTPVNTPTMFGMAAAAAADPASARERVQATVGAAALPNSAAEAVVDIFYSDAS